jgi:hypothetical protein
MVIAPSRQQRVEDAVWDVLEVVVKVQPFPTSGVHFT